jgi:hypothetical protein
VCAPGWPCLPGSEFEVDGTFQTIADANFNPSYADDNYVTGVPGYETIAVEGIAVSNQLVGAVLSVSSFQALSVRC